MPAVTLNTRDVSSMQAHQLMSEPALIIPPRLSSERGIEGGSAPWLFRQHHSAVQSTTLRTILGKPVRLLRRARRNFE